MTGGMRIAVVCVGASVAATALVGQSAGRWGNWALHTPVMILGERDAATDDLLFGSVLDIAVSASGRTVLVVDEDFRNVRTFDITSGRLTGRTGRNGSGPGEMRTPFAAAIDSSGQIHVLDTGNSKVVTFTAQNGRLAVTSESRINFPGRSICSLDGRRYVLAGHGPPIREIAPDGRVIREFGNRQPVPREYRTIMGQNDQWVNNFVLHCHTTQQIVVLANRDLGNVSAYTAGGEALFSTQLGDWYQQGYRAHPNGSCCAYNIPNTRSQSFHYVTALGTSNAGHLVVAATEMTPRDRTYRLEARVIDPRTGRELSRYRTGALRESVRPFRIAGGQVIAFAYRPFPQIQVYKSDF